MHFGHKTYIKSALSSQIMDNFTMTQPTSFEMPSENPKNKPDEIYTNTESKERRK